MMNMKNTFVQRLAVDAGTDILWLRKAVEFGVKQYGFDPKELYKALNSEFRRKIRNLSEFE